MKPTYIPKEYCEAVARMPKLPMTLEEQKLAVCEKLPEIVYIWEQKYWKGGVVTSTEKMLSWKQTDDLDVINRPTEGLQVCHEAEKLIDSQNFGLAYQRMLEKVAAHNRTDKRGRWAVYHATFEQRLEALCRVWFPEKFTTT